MSASIAQAEEADGISVEAAYTVDILAGGQNNPTYVDNLDLILDARAQETHIHLYGLYNNGTAHSGRRFSRGYVASNIETGVRAARLYEAWIEQSFAHGKLSVLAGLFDYNSEFDALEASSLFINPTHGIGNDISQAGLNGPSIFPTTSIALRVQAKPREDMIFRAAIFDGVPGDPAHPKQTVVKLGKGDGAFVAAEIEKRIGNWRLVGGYWHHTSRFRDELATLRAGQIVNRRGNRGYYLRGEGAFIDRMDGRNGSAFFRLGKADSKLNETSFLASAGLHFIGPLRVRPQDEAGVAFSVSHSSRRAREFQALRGDPIKRHEASIELTYSLKINDWLRLQPDVQYLANPAFEHSRSAWVWGMRLQTTRKLVGANFE